MRWEQGRVAIDGMIAAGEIQRVAPSRERADELIRQATSHITTARAAADKDPEGAYTLIYDAARKTLVALLQNEGLRPTSRAGHHGVYLAVRAQLDPPLGQTLRPFERMRRRRNAIEYPDFVEPAITPDDVREEIPVVEALISLVMRVNDEMSPY